MWANLRVQGRTPSRSKGHPCPSGLQVSEPGLTWPCPGREQGGREVVWRLVALKQASYTSALTPSRPFVGSLETPTPDLQSESSLRQLWVGTSTSVW